MMRAMQRHGRAVAWVLAASLAWMSVPRRAEAEVIDRVVAVLDEEAIFLSELERRARPFLIDIPASAPAEERAARRQAVLREVLDRMIDDALLRQAATRLHVSVTDEDVDQFIERIARERGATVDQMYEALQHEGVSRADYRAHMETEVRRLKVLQQRVRGRISITDADLQEAYRRCRANRGAPGVDGQSFAHIEAQGLAAWLRRLKQEMRAMQYRCAPLLRVWIPKANGGQRPLGIPTIRDRVAQMAVLLVLGPIFDEDLFPWQYGFREGMDAKMALRRVHFGIADRGARERERRGQRLFTTGPVEIVGVHLQHHVAAVVAPGQFGQHLIGALVARARQQVLVLGRPVAVGEVDVHESLAPGTNQVERVLPGRRGVRKVERQVVVVEIGRIPARLLSL